MNYYELLGVSSDASSEDIKRAYKIQMKKWHPDINKDSEAVSMSMKINEAKDTLLDEVKRREYDDFLNHKNTSTYNKYSNGKTSSSNNDYKKYETQMVTKWDYLRDYMNSDSVNFVKKIIAFILVMLESFLCFVLKWIVIGLAFISFFLSDLIISAFYYLYPIFALFILYLGIIVYKDGSASLFTSHVSELRGVLIIVVVYISSYLFAFFGKKLLSQKVFEFLYNKLDIYLFKKAVGYK